MNQFGPALRWMLFEAAIAGLRLSSAPQPRIVSKATSSTAVSSNNVAGAPDKLAGRFPVFNTRLLKPQTHKVSRGQLVVLPSGSLLVDFREGERRKGRGGKEVFVVLTDGANVCCRLTLRAYV